MQITQTKQEDLRREFTVRMTAEEISRKIEEKLAALGQSVKMPGFRPGKVPMNVLKSKYGKAVMGEVLEAAVNESSLQAINENKLRPAMRPQIEVKTFDEKNGLEYNMAIELLPEIKLMDLGVIKLEKLTAKPAEKDVTDALQRIARANKTTEKIEGDRAAQNGDILLIDFDGTVDGERRPGMKSEDFELELGSKSFIDTFEDQLVGAKAGETRTVKVTFPKDYGQQELRGVKAEFKVTVKDLRRGIVPEINDDFAKMIGFGALADVQRIVLEQIQNDYDQLTRLHLKRRLLDMLDDNHVFDVPAGMVEAEFRSIWQQVKGQGHAHDHDDPGHVHGPDCAHDHGTEEEREEFQAIAERRVRLGLVLAEIGRLNKVEVSGDELQKAVITEARRYPGREKQVFEFYQKNPQALESIKAPIYEEKVIDIILAGAKVESREVSIEELNKAAEEETSEPVSKEGGKKKAAKKK